jgi:hypothetical protein
MYFRLRYPAHLPGAVGDWSDEYIEFDDKQYTEIRNSKSILHSYIICCEPALGVQPLYRTKHI